MCIVMSTSLRCAMRAICLQANKHSTAFSRVHHTAPQQVAGRSRGVLCLFAPQTACRRHLQHQSQVDNTNTIPAASPVGRKEALGDVRAGEVGDAHAADVVIGAGLLQKEMILMEAELGWPVEPHRIKW
jgi:hypothetical protein